MVNRKLLSLVLAAGCLAAVTFPRSVPAADASSVPKWGRFDLVLKSSVAYTNALQQAEVRALFVSPLGETNRVYGFWDGGKTWRVRYQPDFPGRWTYYTMCSDTANAGLHEQTGEFLCTAPTSDNRFAEHGPLRVARDNQHFEHADHTPFLWLGDAAWHATARAKTAEWTTYVKTRAAQKFNVVQWQLPADVFSGSATIRVNLALCKQLDAKIETANGAGLLNAIAPLWEIGANANDILPEDQAIALLRYVIARWGADNVAWIVAFESDNTGAQAARWQRLGRAAFNSVSHAPVILLPGESDWVLDEFRRERWVDALGFQTTQVSGEDTLPWLLTGPLSLERRKSPARPLLTIAPPAELAGDETNTPAVAANFARRLLWWSLLVNTPAGVSYCARDVAEWTGDPKAPADTQPWLQALSLPGAEAMAPLNDCFQAKEFWLLQPFAQSLAVQPGTKFPRGFIAATSTEAHDWSVIYAPSDRAVDFKPGVLSNAVKATWINPRTGESAKASAVANTASTKFTTPSSADWALVLEAHK
jgi:Protein of unknown function (DUF4038)/Domain of unknown function (DUF5060)/Putative collagen-binding domain of a collagenase